MSTTNTSVLSADELRAMLLDVAARVVASERLLCDADRHIGDGDHGRGMARGFTAAADRLTTMAPDRVSDVLATVGNALIATMGGASGVVFGLLFRPATPAVLDASAIGVDGLAAHFAAALEQIVKRGGARVGDKTMLDALAPAVDALHASARDGLTMAAALERAADAARAGAERSAALAGRRGKAMTLGERARGFPDPGAVSTALIFQTMADWAGSGARQPVPQSPVTSVAGRVEEES